MTITEALAEIKLIDQKIDKKRVQIRTFLTRQEMLKDPLSKDGGSTEYIKREEQAIRDLEQRKIDLRLAIAETNERTEIEVAGEVRTIAEWLVWKREVYPKRSQYLINIRQLLDQARQQAQARGGQVITDGGASITKPTDIIVNVDEAALGRETEHLTDIFGTLDGQLSLKNATVKIDPTL